jgi:SAM-dependent methyltransferase
MADADVAVTTVPAAAAPAAPAGFEAIRDLLRCPRCKGPMTPPHNNAMRCADGACARSYPVVMGKPVLIDEERSVFLHADYLVRATAATEAGALSGVKEWLRWLPSPSVNMSAIRCLARMRDMLLGRGGNHVVLVVGGGLRGKGVSQLVDAPGLRVINVDPAPDSAAAVFCDAHDLPFADGSVDAVVVQAVLEHVADPWRCVDEIHRVLKPEGIVYSETPFMQQVHLRGYDFTRFSHIGHRRLFRRFAELESGAVAGPGTALAWAWRYFLASFARSPRAAKVLFWIGRVTGIVIEQFDHLLKQRPGALDGASCVFFLGTRSPRAISDRDVLAGYRGAQRS